MFIHPLNLQEKPSDIAENKIEPPEPDRDYSYYERLAGSWEENLYDAIEVDNINKFKQYINLFNKHLDLTTYVDYVDLFMFAWQERAEEITVFLLEDAEKEGIICDIKYYGLYPELSSKDFQDLDHVFSLAGVTLSFFDNVGNGIKLIQTLEKRGKFKRHSFEELLSLSCTDVNEPDLMQYLISKESRIQLLKHALQAGGRLNDDYREYACSAALDLLEYRPGRAQPSLFEIQTHRRIDREQITRVILDYEDTTDQESSADEKTMSSTLVNRAQGVSSKKLSRGVHFAPSYFLPEQRRQVYQRPFQPTATASMAVMQDVGFDADDEFEESDPDIEESQGKILNFFQRLKNEEDKPEPKKRRRNKRTFTSLEDRFVQAYVMNYKYLVTDNQLQSFFGAPVPSNPLVSTSYSVAKAAMYASGLRSEQKAFSERRLDPHYRRSTGKPKHPHLGYVEYYDVPDAYIQEQGYDIVRMAEDGRIGISHLYKYEQEVAFPALLPKQFHCGRFFLTVPRFDRPWSKQMLKQYGISKRDYTRYRNKFRSSSEYKRDYPNTVKLVTERVIKHQLSGS